MKWQRLPAANRYTAGPGDQVNLAEPKLHASKTGASVQIAEKIMAVGSRAGMISLQLVNEYGNSVRYEISSSHQFESLFANLWQFVKDRQH
jgi:hypothetical protein